MVAILSVYLHLQVDFYSVKFRLVSRTSLDENKLSPNSLEEKFPVHCKFLILRYFVFSNVGVPNIFKKIFQAQQEFLAVLNYLLIDDENRSANLYCLYVFPLIYIPS